MGWLERHLMVFCIDLIVPGFVIYYVNCPQILMCYIHFKVDDISIIEYIFLLISINLPILLKYWRAALKTVTKELKLPFQAFVFYDLPSWGYLDSRFSTFTMQVI